MIGERLESQFQVPWFALVLVIAGLGLMAVGFSTQTSPMLAASVLPLAIGASLLVFGRPPQFSALVGENGLEVEGSGGPLVIPYASIRNIKADGRPADPRTASASASIAVQHDGGVLHIPGRLNVPTGELLRVLVDRVPTSGGRDVNPDLVDYLQRQEMYFDAESVATYCAARRLASGSRRGLRAFAVGMIVGGVIETALASSGRFEVAWAVPGVFCAAIGLVMFITSFAETAASGPLLKQWRKSSLVVGPTGLAMVQGPIHGEVRWPELLEIRFQPKPRGFPPTPANLIPGILLRVKGADIIIADIYDRPLCVIHGRIMAAAGRAEPLVEEL